MTQPLVFMQDDTFASSPFAAVQELFRNEILSIQYPNGVGEYEENIEFEGCLVTFDGGGSIEMSGYHGMHETLCFDKLRDNWREQLHDDLLEWMEWYYTNN